MSSDAIIGAIPARYASSRLPGKPLLPLAGKPMIEHVYRRACQAASLDRVVVLTDDRRIAEAVDGFGGHWQMTPEDCRSGTDRIASVAADWQAKGVVNIQGDEPLIDPQAIDAIAQELRSRYLLTFQPPTGASGPRVLRLDVAAEGAEVRTRPGYTP